MTNTEQAAVHLINKFFYDILEESRDSDEAVDELRDELIDELELTRKEAARLRNIKDATFEEAMALLEKALQAGYYLFEAEIVFFLDFLLDPRYNRKYRHTKKFLKAHKC